MSDAYIIAGLCFGDEGKGSMVDYLCRETGAKLVVRYNGGPQAAHNVVLSDGRHHTFAQFGSGALMGAKTYLSRFMLIEPFALLNEHEVLAPKVGRHLLKDVYVEAGCPIITPFHWKTQRLRAGTRGASCGMGVGELRRDQADGQPVMTIGDFVDWDWNHRYWKLRDIRERKVEEVCASGGDVSKLHDLSIPEIIDTYAKFIKQVNIVPNGSLKKLIDGPIVLEGAQGVLLDETHGSAPFNTWTDTTFANAYRLLDGLGMTNRRIGIVRTYFTRHGAGPFPTESRYVNHPEKHNGTGEWQGIFRQGYFDARAIRYAIDVCGGIDGLAVTHMDRSVKGKDFLYTDDSCPDNLVFSRVPTYVRTWQPVHDVIQEAAGCEIVYTSHGPTEVQKESLVLA